MNLWLTVCCITPETKNKKMKSLILVSVIFTIGFTLSSFSVHTAKTQQYVVEISDSQFKWTGYHLAKSYEHWGYVNLKSGTISTDGQKITSGDFVIDMSSIQNMDVENHRDKAKLVNQLKSDDFFNVKKFPEARLVIKRTAKKTGNMFTTTADLTIRGITKEIVFDSEMKAINEDQLQVTATLRVPRADFKVMYGWKMENAILANEFQMDVKLIAKRTVDPS